MSKNKSGRPVKEPEKKRIMVHLSLYTEDLEKLDRLTINRSRFIRQKIQEEWDAREGGQSFQITFQDKRGIIQLLKAIIGSLPLSERKRLISELEE